MNTATPIITWTFTDRQGRSYTGKGTRADAERMLAHYDENEAMCKRVAPTYSGDTRFNDRAEANAIRAALA